MSGPSTEPARPRRFRSTLAGSLEVLAAPLLRPLRWLRQAAILRRGRRAGLAVAERGPSTERKGVRASNQGISLLRNGEVEREILLASIRSVRVVYAESPELEASFDSTLRLTLADGEVCVVPSSAQGWGDAVALLSGAGRIESVDEV